LQPLAEDTFRFENPGDGKAEQPAAGRPTASWFFFALAHADRASTAGFVLSMMFLAATAIYALTLSDAAKPVFAEVAALADRAAFDAGFRLEDLALSGSENTPRAALLEALRLPYKGSSISYDTAGAHDRPLRLGWIEAAEVRRILPSRLEVIVSERTPFARWEKPGNQIQAIDREGHVLGPDAEGRFSSLPLLAGEEAPAEAADFEDALSDNAAIKRRIERAELITGRFWLAKLDTGLMLKLPRKVSILVLNRLDSLLANPKIAEMGLETIDLRLSNRTILQLREATVANRDRAIASLLSTPQQAVAPPRRGKAL
jgi:cell division protein FtsQ